MSKNLSGERFDRLLVLNRTNERYKSTGSFIWKCLCECGKVVRIPTSSLTTGNTRSCGCLNREKSVERGKNKALDLRNQRFGRLLALCPTDQRRGTFIIWKCMCECLNISYVASGDLTSGHTKSCGCLKLEASIQNLPNDYKGEKHWNWRGGITPKDRQARNTVEYRDWRNSVFIRDNYLCQKCLENGYLHAHHILSFDDYVNLRYDTDNGITLCASCHRLFHLRYNEYSEECLKEYLHE